MGTSGSEGGQQKPTSREAGRALLSDPYTEIPTADGKLYLATVIDLYSRRLLAAATSQRCDAGLCEQAIKIAVAVRGGKSMINNVVFHTDRGPPIPPDPSPGFVLI